MNRRCELSNETTRRNVPILRPISLSSVGQIYLSTEVCDAMGWERGKDKLRLVLDLKRKRAIMEKAD